MRDIIPFGMKRRRFLQGLLATPAAPALLAQGPGLVPAADAPPELTFAVADDAADTLLEFFDERQYATLGRLSALLMPAMDGRPGALECSTPEFLDFLLSESLPSRQQLYLQGLDTLEYQAQTRFSKPFAETSEEEAGQLLAPLRQPWTYQAPSQLAAFLRQAKQDIPQATTNSRQWGNAVGSRVGQYWLPVE